MRRLDASNPAKSLFPFSVLLPAVLIAASAAAFAAEQAPAPDPPAPADGAPAGWLQQVQRDIAASEYEVTWQDRTALVDLDAAWQAPNRAHGFRTYFTESGIRVIPRTEEDPSWEWGLELVGYGRGGQVWPVAAASLRPSGNRIEYARGGISEWYVNEPRGLEQGFTLDARPEEVARAAGAEAEEVAAPRGEGGVPLDADRRGRLVFVQMALTGNLDPAFGTDGPAIDFRTAGGVNVLHFAELRVTDATGRELPARMEGFAATGARAIRIVYDDSNAAYPITIDPLATTPAWTIAGDQYGALFGWAVSFAGDVNGDGYSDVIVGAEEYDNGETGEGRAYVYHGSATGLSASPAWIAESDQAYASFGSSVATAGDVNGDGYSDVIVGADEYDNGQTGEGRAYVYHGSAAGLSPAPAWTAESDKSSARFGDSVSTAGDVNGDGYSDVIVGATGYSNFEVYEGRAYVYHGSATGLSATAAWTAESDQASALFGYSVSTAGDVNGDGYSDVIVGAQLCDSGETDEGRAYVYHGSAEGLSESAAWTAESDQAGAEFGVSVSTAGDVNGDGYSDVIVGAIRYDNGQTDEGRAYVYHGSAAGLSATAAWAAESDQASAYFGRSVATAGDVNGDGYSDVIVGAHFFDSGETDEGRAYVYHGSAEGLSACAAWTAESDQAGGRFGLSVATAGDVNGDGYSDVIVGAYGYDGYDRYYNVVLDVGRAFVYHGSAAGLSATSGWTGEGNQASAYFGYSVATAGDVNGDGYSDVIVGAYGYDNGQADEGRAFVYHGSAAGLSADAAWTAESDQASAWFGGSVATAGDVNGDGYADVIVGAQYYDYDNEESDAGRAYVYHGSASGLSAVAAWTAEIHQQMALLGYSVSTAGDVNGDGYSDVIVGVPSYDGDKLGEGLAYVYHGSAAGLSTVAAWIREGDEYDALFGASVSSAGDVNGDGYSDVIVGAPWYAVDGDWAGRAFVFHGSPTGLSPTHAWTAEAGQYFANFGEPVSSAGDVNGDGYSDVIVGAYGYDNGQADEGRAFVYHGSASGLSASAAWTAESDQSSAYFGVSVATAGDVNGDGYSDVIVGAHYHDNIEANEGRAHVYHGSAAGLGATAAWTAEPDQAGAGFGRSVATAGDVNGDGYSDVIVGADRYDNGQTDEGRAFLYYGNGGPGLSLRPQQRRADDTAPIAPLGASDSAHGFRLALTGRSPFGRGSVRLQWEVKPLGSLFDGTETGTGDVVDAGVTGYDFDRLVANLSSGVAYHWRVRLLYDRVSIPFQPSSRWLTVSLGGWNEADIRTPVAPCEDADGDGYGSPGSTLCSGGPETDCDDANASVYPVPDEICNGLIDNPCESVTPPRETDGDADSYVECAPWVGSVGGILGGGDCDDTNASVHPGAAELCDGLDDDCDLVMPLTEYDDDGDSWVECAPWVGSGGGILGGGDCDDTNTSVHPGAEELCDGLDNDCSLFYSEVDHDGDSYVVCTPWVGSIPGILGGGDCDDYDESRFPGAPESCNGLDDDCDRLVPPAEIDDDGDLYVECEVLVWEGIAEVLGGGDCDDTDPTSYPFATEVCDHRDNDCDSIVDEDWPAPEVRDLSFFDERRLTWSPDLAIPGGSYDVTKGDLIAMLSNGGDFTTSFLSCLESDDPDPNATDPESPAVHRGFYYLVRGRNECTRGTYDDPWFDPSSQVGSRDLEIEAAVGHCP